MTDRILYGYFRSSAAYRVRMALNLKGLPYTQQPVNLRAGEHKLTDFSDLNPQQLVPVLLDKGGVINQSMAIIEYLDEAYPDTPPLLPKEPMKRAQVRAMAQMICCDIHPINNLRVLHYLDQMLGEDEKRNLAWYAHWIQLGFEAIETKLRYQKTPYALTDTISMADICLLPQVFNARRFEVDLQVYPRILALESKLLENSAIAAAHPCRQPDCV